MSMEEALKQNKKFAYTLAIVFTLIAVYRIFLKHQNGWWALIGLSIVLLLLSFVKPILLNQTRLGWEKFGQVLGVINTYVLLTVFYFLILTPLGLLMRLFGKDILKLKKQNNLATYWEQDNSRTDASMKNQF